MNVVKVILSRAISRQHSAVGSVNISTNECHLKPLGVHKFTTSRHAQHFQDVNMGVTSANENEIRYEGCWCVIDVVVHPDV